MEVYWKAVTYRTVAIYLLMIFAIVIAILYMIYPESYSNAVAKVTHALGAAADASADSLRSRRNS